MMRVLRPVLVTVLVLAALLVLLVGGSAAYQAWDEHRTLGHYRPLLQRAVAAHATGNEVWELLGRDKRFFYSSDPAARSVTASSRHTVGIPAFACAIVLTLWFAPAAPLEPLPPNVLNSLDTLERAEVHESCSGT